ncbi:cellulose-binding domain-containing protein [Actinoplanes sp. KI2]|uniref:cellulose-binding domain-containing protein n=1 Tax=Actinoplanes sp. KI2 TaxID=2983315 RepID=UPI0021D5B36B|nr:cellulose-binding domain-containing protein [Actinoplanes sp. KI2]MCU7729073.1 cellulose-binding domain-containing protein [Actinoplanes sp. KI2]
MALSRRSILALCAGLGGTVVLATLAMSPAAALSAGGCTATAHIDSQWGSGTGGGQIVTATVTNTSATTTTKWTVTWTLGAGQQVVSGWNAAVSASGSSATAVNAAYNGSLAPGGSTTFGMQLAGTGPAPVLGCDNGATPPASSPPPSSSPPPGGPDVTVGPGDSQRSITLVVGQTLGVSLGAEYRTPAIVGAALTQVSASGGYPSGQPLDARYRAVAAGQADLRTQSDAPCLHTTPPCTIPVSLWTVHVTVVAATGQTVTVSTADNESTVRLHVGDTLVVSLAVNYLPPTLSGTGVLVLRDTTGGYPTGQPLVTRYLAAAAGTVKVSTRTDIACNHEPTPCPSPQIPWTVTADVTA